MQTASTLCICMHSDLEDCVCVRACVCACVRAYLELGPMQLPSPLHVQQTMLANASCMVTPAPAG